LRASLSLLPKIGKLFELRFFSHIECELIETHCLYVIRRFCWIMENLDMQKKLIHWLNWNNELTF
jgi:hypothetical protein